MAARAHDVAALCLRGDDAHLNFPDLADTLPRPARLSPKCIQEAATSAALSFEERLAAPEVASYSAGACSKDDISSISTPGDVKFHQQPDGEKEKAVLTATSTPGGGGGGAQAVEGAGGVESSSEGAAEKPVEYLDEDLIFNMPAILSSMAHALSVSPPQLQDDQAAREDEESSEVNIWDPCIWDRYS